MATPYRHAQRFGLYVKNIPKDYSEQFLHTLLAEYGPVESVRIVVNDNYMTNRAYVYMETKDGFDSVLKNLNGWRDGNGGVIYIEILKTFNDDRRVTEDGENLVIQVRQQTASDRSPASPNDKRGGNIELRSASQTTQQSRNPNSRSSAYEYSLGRNQLSYASNSQSLQWRPQHTHRPRLLMLSTQTGHNMPYKSRPERMPNSIRSVRARDDTSYPRVPNPVIPSQTARLHHITNNNNSYASRGHRGTSLPNSSAPPPGTQMLNRPRRFIVPNNERMSPLAIVQHPSAGKRMPTPVGQHPSAGNRMPTPVGQRSCAMCHLPAINVCSSCGKAYCSQLCQNQDWESGHKYSCTKVEPNSSSESDAESARSSINNGSAGLPLHTVLQVKLTDFESPSQFFIKCSGEKSKKRLNRVHECSLYGVVPPNEAQGWSDVIEEVLCKTGLAIGGMCKVYCVQQDDDVYEVNLSTRNGDVDIAETLVEAGLAAFSQPRVPSKPASSYSSTPYQSAAFQSVPSQPVASQSAPSQPVASQSAPFEASASQSTQSESFVQVENKPQTASTHDNSKKKTNPKCRVTESLHKRLKPGDDIEIYIDESSVEGVTLFFAQIASFTPVMREFLEMGNTIQSYASHVANKPPPGYRAEPGDYVLAQFERVWYRGEITAANEHTAVVAYIDYGNIAAVEQKDLLPLPERFTYVPSLATQFKIHNLNDVEDEAMKDIAVKKIKAFSEDLIRAKVYDVSEDCISVEVFSDDGQRLSEAIISAGYSGHSVTQDEFELVEPASLSANNTDKNKVNASGVDGVVTFLSDLPTFDVPIGVSILAKVVRADNLRTIYVQSSSNSVDELIDAVEVYGDQVRFHPPKTKLVVNEMVLAFNPNYKRWDRVVIEDICNDGLAYRVRSIDNGFVYEAVPCNIRAFPEELKQIAACSIHILLSDVSGELSDTGRNLLNNLVGQTVKVTPSSVRDDGSIYCMMTTEQGTNVNRHAVKHLKGSSDSIQTAPSPTKPKQYTNKARKCVMLSELPDPVLGRRIQCKVINASRVNSVLIQTASQADLDRIAREIKVISPDLSKAKIVPKSVRKNEVLLVYVPDGRIWDRVLVLEDSSMNIPTVKVQSLEHGRKFYPKITDLREFSDCLLQYPPSCLQVSLQGLKGRLNYMGSKILNSAINDDNIEVDLLATDDGIECKMFKGTVYLNAQLFTYLLPEVDESAIDIGAGETARVNNSRVISTDRNSAQLERVQGLEQRKLELMQRIRELEMEKQQLNRKLYGE